jgi:HopA1 effector protein family
MELKPDLVQRLQRLPSELQTRYLSLQLQSFLYQIYFNGSWRVGSQLNPDNTPFENNTVRGINIEFYDLLHTSNCGEGYFDPGWLILKQEEDGSLAVQKQDLTLHIQRDRHLHPRSQSTNVGEEVAVRLPRNLLVDEFYVAVGNAGLPSCNQQQLANIYFNLEPESLAAAMKSVTQQLNQLSLPFTFQTICHPPEGDRYDTGILKIAKDDYASVRPLLQRLYQKQQSHFRPDMPLFTKPLAPGLALAEEPKGLDLSASHSEQFGTHRCQLLAAAILDAHHSGQDSPQARMASIFQNFSAQGIEMRHPYLSADSTDIYERLIF